MRILKVREDRLRRIAARQSLTLVKSRSRGPHDLEPGYMIVDGNTNSVVAGGSPMAYSVSLDEAEHWLITSPGNVAYLSAARKRGLYPVGGS